MRGFVVAIAVACTASGLLSWQPPARAGGQWTRSGLTHGMPLLLVKDGRDGGHGGHDGGRDGAGGGHDHGGATSGAGGSPSASGSSPGGASQTGSGGQAGDHRGRDAHDAAEAGEHAGAVAGRDDPAGHD